MAKRKNRQPPASQTLSGASVSQAPDERSGEISTGSNIYPAIDAGNGAHAGKAVDVIGEEEVVKAAKILKKYKDGKANLENRIVQNEEWFKMRHWAQLRKPDDKQNGDDEYASAWLFNVLINKHADAMDNIPEPVILPREESDQEEASKLSAIIPVVMEQCRYQQVYSDMWWYKLKAGTGVTGIFWDPAAGNGVGDIAVKSIDLLNCFWEPGIADIQESPNFYTVRAMDKAALEIQYPQLRGEMPGPGADADVAKYIYDESIDATGKVPVVDWYYKRTLPNGRTVLHLCKYVGKHVLYASENEPALKERGFYDHGRYPFIFDTLFKVEGTPAGFGYLDVCKSAQIQIDKLNRAIMKNAMMASRPRWFIRGDGTINEEEYADWDRDFVHYSGNGSPKENISPLEVPQLPAIYANLLDQKVNELKEVSGNRDFAQGGTSGGVTAASAIASLQEAGNKLSRDMNASAYRAYEQVCLIVIELIRQFYDAPRCFRITGENGAVDFAHYDNANIKKHDQTMPGAGAKLGERLPIFDIKVKSQKRSPFATAVENERAKELYGMGFFNPAAADAALGALDMMTFEGKDKIVQSIKERGTMISMLQEKVRQLSHIVDAQNGTTIEQGITGAITNEGNVPTQAAATPSALETNMLGAARARQTSQEGVARTRAAAASTPKI